MKVINKWNNRVYKIINIENNQVTLERDDGTRFTITKQEYFFTYREVRNGE